MTDDSPILCNIEDGVAFLTLNRPHIHNAFDDQLIAQFSEYLISLKSNAKVKILALQGNGASFCAGADLNWMQRMVAYSEEENFIDALALAKLLQLLYNFNKPTVAFAQGATFGGGLGLLACCQLVIVTDNAQFCFSEVKLGLIPAVISPYIIAAIGERHARAFFLSARKFDSQTALAIGLCHEVVKADKLSETIDNTIRALLKNGPQAMMATNALVDKLTTKTIDDDIINVTAREIAKIRVSSEGQEGLKAFLEKRKPNWTT